LDALSPLGIKTLDMPLKPEKIWTLVQAARRGTLSQSESSVLSNFPLRKQTFGDKHAQQFRQDSGQGSPSNVTLSAAKGRSQEKSSLQMSTAKGVTIKHYRPVM
jgi:hypothetical protein